MVACSIWNIDLCGYILTPPLIMVWPCYWLENNSRRVNKDILLCDRYLACMLNCWIYYLDNKHVTARKAGHYLLVRKNTWRGWDNWWSQDIDFGWFDTLRGLCRVSCVISFRGTPFWSARFVRVVYLMVDDTIRYTWSSPGGSMRDPPLLVSQVNPVYEFTD